MSLAAYIVTILACTAGGVTLGYALARSRHHAEDAARLHRAADELARPHRRPPPSRERRNGYHVTPVDAQCIKASCRHLHPDPDVVLVGIGLSGSSYQCRHCLETW